MSQANLIVQMANVIADQENTIEMLTSDKEWHKSEYARIRDELEKEKAKIKYTQPDINGYAKEELVKMMKVHFDGKKIDAIKFIRGLYDNLGLKEAKDWVEINLYGNVPF